MPASLLPFRWLGMGRETFLDRLRALVASPSESHFALTLTSDIANEILPLNAGAGQRDRRQPAAIDSCSSNEPRTGVSWAGGGRLLATAGCPK